MAARSSGAFPDMLGGQATDALVDRECLPQIRSGLAGVAVVRSLWPIPSRRVLRPGHAYHAGDS